MDPKIEQRLGTGLGVVGLIVAVIGLAGPLPSNTPLAAALAGGGLLGAAVGALIHLHARSLPAFSIVRQHTKYELTKADGSECTCQKEIHFRCNLREQREFIHRNIFADGSVKDFRWDGDGVIGLPESKAGEWVVPIRRDPSWPTGRKHTHSGTLYYRVLPAAKPDYRGMCVVPSREWRQARRGGRMTRIG